MGVSPFKFCICNGDDTSGCPFHGGIMEANIQRDRDCFAKAVSRGQFTFTLVEQDMSSPKVICEWIKENIETCPAEKLEHALTVAIKMRDSKNRKVAD